MKTIILLISLVVAGSFISIQGMNIIDDFKTMTEQRYAAIQ